MSGLLQASKQCRIARFQSSQHRALSVVAARLTPTRGHAPTRSIVRMQRVKPLAWREISNESNVGEYLENKSSEVNDKLADETARIIRLAEESNDEQAKIECKTIDDLMHQWSKRAGSGGGLLAAERSHDLLKMMEANFDGLPKSANFSLIPDAASYNFVLQAYASCNGRREAATAASDLLNRMISRCRDTAEQSRQAPAPTRNTFNIVLNAWAKSASEDSGRKAEEIFAQLEDWQLECQRLSLPEAVPNGRTLCGVMDAWANSRSLDAAERVMAILEVAIERQKKLFEGKAEDSERGAIKPDVIMFNSAIRAWVNSGKAQYGAEKAEQVLQLMKSLHESGELGPRSETDEDDAGLAPTTRSFTMLINAWAETERTLKAGRGAERAEQILEDMITQYLERGEDVMPNTMTFTTCIKAWSKSVRHPQYDERAQGVFDRMGYLYRETKNDHVKPNAWAANTLITAWAKSRTSNSAERAEAVLTSLKEFCQPDVYTYNSVIDAYAKKRLTKKALVIFEELENNPTVQPDIISYNTMLNAWAKDKHNSGEALILLERMIADGVVKPDRVSYSCVLTACAYNKNPRQNGAQTAERILHAMVREYRAGNNRVQPDVITLTAAINAAANATGGVQDQRAALKFAIATLEQMKQSDDLENPNHLTYGAMMKACSRLCRGKERARLLEGVFQQSINDGMVSAMVLDIFKSGVPGQVQRKFKIQSEAAMPAVWCSNVTPRDMPKLR